MKQEQKNIYFKILTYLTLAEYASTEGTSCHIILIT
jgi:hypothetical protein